MIIQLHVGVCPVHGSVAMVCVCVCVWGGEKGEVGKEKGEKETV